MRGWKDNWLFYVLFLVLIGISVAFAIDKIDSKADKIYVDKQDSLVVDKLSQPLKTIIIKIDSLPLTLKKDSK
jgi:hypothetical protein